MWLIIDDERTLGCDVIVKHADAGMNVLRAMSDCFEGLCIDHDLGQGKTGYDVIKWALKNNCCPVHVQIVSHNPVGAQNIGNVLQDNGYRSKDNVNWFFVRL